MTTFLDMASIIKKQRFSKWVFESYIVLVAYKAVNVMPATNQQNLFRTVVRMGWDAAKAWASQLTITDATYGTVSGWRLPSARLQTPVNYDRKYDGSTDYGHNNTRSELGHMFFNNLGNKAVLDVNGNQQSGNGVTSSIYTDANGSISIQNLQNAYYWNDEAYVRNSGDAWAFGTDDGLQDYDYKNDTFFAWAVREGDVASEVPLPAAAWLFGSALVGLVGLRRKK